MAKTLRVVILIARIILGCAVVLMLIAAVWMATSTSLQEEFMGMVEMADKPNSFFLPLTCLVLAVISAAWFWVLHILSKVVNTLIEGDPFVIANINRLRMMWIIIALTEVFRMVMKVYATSGIESGDNGWEIRIGTWFLVFVIATLAEAFRHGAKMRQEQELTI